jgi:ureidoglycolate hydrolase
MDDSASVVAGEPIDVRAFVTLPGQGVSYLRGIWHGVLMPLNRPNLFAVVARIRSWRQSRKALV